MSAIIAAKTETAFNQTISTIAVLKDEFGVERVNNNPVVNTILLNVLKIGKSTEEYLINKYDRDSKSKANLLVESRIGESVIDAVVMELEFDRDIVIAANAKDSIMKLDVMTMLSFIKTLEGVQSSLDKIKKQFLKEDELKREEELARQVEAKKTEVEDILKRIRGY